MTIHALTTVMGAEDIQTAATVITWVLGLIIAVGGASTVIIRMMSPFKVLKKRVDEHDKRLDKHDTFFAADKARMDKADETNKLILKAMLALVDHGIDGNNIERLKTTKTEINNYLINK